MHGIQGHDEREMLDARTAARLSGRLRLARQTRTMTLKVLADAAGCSESLLSKIENGKAYPSLPMLNRLAKALDLSMSWIFEDRERREPIIVRAGQRPPFTADETRRTITVERVIPEGDERMLQCGIYHVESGAASSGDQQHTGEETGYLLEGQLDLVIGGQAHHLRAGDAFAFHSDQPHSYRNAGATRASIFWVKTPPLS